MKRTIAAVVIGAILALGCADSKVIDDKTYHAYGLLTMNQQDPSIRYSKCWGNVFWGVVLVETIVIPIWLFGWGLYEPEEKR